MRAVAAGVMAFCAILVRQAQDRFALSQLHLSNNVYRPFGATLDLVNQGIHGDPPEHRWTLVDSCDRDRLVSRS